MWQERFMTTFLALYRGTTIAEAKIVAVTADPALVAVVARQLLDTPQPEDDPVVTAIERGRKHALRLIKREARHVQE
jgi:hypothetical protein